jgi:hypothetical protein
MLFLADYLDYVANDTTFHIDALAWESGNSIDQKKADTLMGAMGSGASVPSNIFGLSQKIFSFP